MTEASRLAFSPSIKSVEAVMRISSRIEWTSRKLSEIASLVKFCDSDEDIDLIMHMISSIVYVDGNRLEDVLAEIAKKIASNWMLSPSDTRIVFKDIEGKTDSSAALQQMIKPHFANYSGWSSNKNFVPSLKTVIADTTVNNIVIVDDFSGTGRSLKKLVDWIDLECKSIGRERVNVYAAFVGGMQKTLDLSYSPSLKSIHISINCKRLLSDLIPKSQLSLSVAAMKLIEARHGSIPSSYTLGYKKSQAGFVVQNLNPPNNNLPLIWSHSKAYDHTALFPRMSKDNA